MADAPTNGSTPQAATASVTVPQVSADAYVRQLRDEHGNNDRAALRRAGKDNQKLRRKNAALAQELDGYKTRNPQGSIVLVGDDVTAWNELKSTVATAKEKGIKLPDLPKVLKERDELLVEKSKVETKSAARKAGEALGFKGDGLDLFEQIATDKGLLFEEKEVTVMKGNKAEKVKRWHSKKSSDEKASPVLIEDSAELKPWLKALRAASSEQGDNGSDSDDASDSTSDSPISGSEEEVVHTFIPEQKSSGGGGKRKDFASGFMKSRYPTPSEEAKGKEKKE